MATTEEMTLMTVIDKNGNKYLLYPITKMDCVDGLEEALGEKAQSDHKHDYLPLTGGAMQGDINMNGHVLWGLSNPTGYDQPVPYGMHVDDLAGKTPLIDRGVYTGDINIIDNDAHLYHNSIVWFNQDTQNLPSTHEFYGWLETWTTAGCNHIQRITFITGASAQRMYFNGAWLEWEWINPPMQVGVEYRTMERWQGAAVYTMLIEAGAVPHAAKSAVAYPNNFYPARVLRVCGQMSSGETLPAYSGDSRATVCASRSYVYIETNDGTWSNYAAQVQVWYLK